MKKRLLLGLLLTICIVIGSIVFSLPYPGGMISYWKLDEAEGTIAYDSVSENDGTLVGGPIWATGQVNGALYFDGVDDYVTGSLEPQTLNTFTLEFWVKPGWRKWDWGGFVQVYQGGTIKHLSRFAGPSYYVNFYTPLSVGYDNLQSGTVLAFGQWHQ